MKREEAVAYIPIAPWPEENLATATSGPAVRSFTCMNCGRPSFMNPSVLLPWHLEEAWTQGGGLVQGRGGGKQCGGN